MSGRGRTCFLSIAPRWGSTSRCEVMGMANDEFDELFAKLSALIDGSHWMNADACAAFLGGIKRRTFLEKIACRHDFPKPARVLGSVKLWKRAEVGGWVEHQRVT